MLATQEQRNQINELLRKWGSESADDWDGVTKEDADLVIDFLLNATPEEYDRACRMCGCTQDHACEGGCHWVEWDLCSKCVSKGADNEP